MMSSFFRNLLIAVKHSEKHKICADALYDNLESQPCIPKEVFAELMRCATSTIEFSFDNIIYKPIDRVAMGSPLGPVLANIFEG